MKKQPRRRDAVEDSTPLLTKPPVDKALRGEARSVPLATREMPPELEDYLAQFYPVFRRLETFDNACSYVLGLLSDLPRKNGEKMTEAIEGIANTEAVHRLMALSPWSAEALDQLRVEHALRHATDPSGEPALIVDEVSQLKQGTRSVGVKRQYLGSEGKTANGQVTVTAHYCDGRFDWPVRGRLYLPKEWAEDAERRRKAGVPEDVRFATKPEIALSLIRQALDWGIPARWVLMDAGYDGLDVLLELERLKLSYCVGIQRTFMVRVPEEVEKWLPTEPARPSKHVDAGTLPGVHRVDKLREALPESLWRRVTYRQGRAGPLTKEFAALRVHCATTTRSGPEVWLLFERSKAEDRVEFKYYVVSARRDISLEEMAQAAHRRALIERNSYENGKGEVGLRDYQGRSWRGFHHHLALVMLALTWLNLQRREIGSSALPPGKPPAATPSRTPPAPPKPSLRLGEQDLRFEAAELSSAPLPIPTQHWESVQEVRRRLSKWFAATVQRVLARRGTLLHRPVFVPLL